MANLVLRTVKGSPLTNLEVDNNFSNINVELGVLTNLATTAKSNLVSAINEVASESTSNVTISGGTIQGVVISNVVLASNVTGAGPDAWETIITTHSATAKERLLANTANASFNITLPASPVLGDEIFIADAFNFGTNSANVLRNGNLIDGLAENLELDVEGAQVQLVYDGSGNWKVYYSSVTSAVTRESLGLATTDNVTFGTLTASTFTGNVSGNITASNVNITGGSITGLTNLVASNIVTSGNVVAVGNVKANFFIGDGSQLTGLPAAGGSGLFNTSISNATVLAVSTIASNVFVAPSTSGKRYIIHSLHVTNIDGTNPAELTASIVGTTYPTISVANMLPVPASSAVELLKKPKVLQPNDYIIMNANANSVLHATATIEEVTGTDLFGAGIDITSANTYTDLHTATANSVIESILLTNDDPTLDVKASVVWTDGSNNIQGYYAFDLIVPADATVEILEQPKYLPNAYKIRVRGNQANRLEASIAGKVKT